MIKPGMMTCLLVALCAAVPAQAEQRAGTFKMVNGTVHVERAGVKEVAQIGGAVM